MFKKPFSRVGMFGRSVVALAIGLSFVGTIWSVYTDSLLHSEVAVGLLSAGLTCIAFLASFYFVPIFEKNRKLSLFSIALSIHAVTYVIFAINRNLYIFIALSVVLTLSDVIRVVCAGEIIRDQTSTKNLGKSEGLIYALSNAGWMIGPLIAGLIADAFGIDIVFALAAMFTAIALIMFNLTRLIDRSKKKPLLHSDIIKNFISFFKDKERAKSYIISGGINFWWAILYLYVPLFIVNQGKLDMLWVGAYFFAIVIPLIMFEYLCGELADKYGYKKIFVTGYAIMGLCAVTLFIFTNIYLMMGLLVLASVGAAMVEPTTEAYFLKITDRKKLDRFYAPYSTAIDSAHLVSKLAGALILFLLPYNYMFLMAGIAMFAYAGLSGTLKRN